jgi:alkylation response protein AidB-like acyl-CoA dehydrogenase
MGMGLRALGRLAGSDVVDRLGVRQPAQRMLYRATRDGFRAAGAAGRTFKTVQRRGQPVRLKPAGDSGVFDLTPSDEQQMIGETFKAFAQEQLRPAAQEADASCNTPKELLGQVSELGLSMLGVPEELGGAVSERSTITSVLAAEALAEGDMGLAVAALASASVASALSLWGDASQQATYLPALVSEDVPAAALALHESRPLFDPFKLKTVAKRSGEDFLLSGGKALVPRAVDASLLIVGAELEGEGPALFLVETAGSGVRAKSVPAAGLRVKATPAMGVRAAALGELQLDEVRLPSSALLGGGDPTIYAECVRRARLAWCALAIGTGKAVLDYVTRYANERIAFGEPISHRQAVAFAISDIAIELEGMRLAVLRAASRADAGKPFAEEVSVARTLCTQRGASIGSEGVQLLGGHGYVKEHPVERWYRDLQAAGVFEGALLV